MVIKATATVLAMVAMGLFVSACGDGEQEGQILRIAGIPDQNATRLARRYELLTSYLSEELGVKVEYVPTVDYSAAVTAFVQDQVRLGWFGGLTGLMARLEVPGSEAIAQRLRDQEFHSVFIVQAGLDARGLEDLQGLTFTFGSELSTSGHLMPRHYLHQGGTDPEADFNGLPNYSGSHDKTWKLVESGAFQAGVLNEAVWEAAVAQGKVDTDKVRVLHTTPPYHDYNWTIRANVDEVYGDGFKRKVQKTLLAIGTDRPELLELFSADGFVASSNSNYAAIQEVAESLGIVE